MAKLYVPWKLCAEEVTVNVWQLGMCSSREVAMCRVGRGDLDRHQKLSQPLRIGGFDGMGEREEEEA